jgi:YbbR domain-containing protein
VSEAKTLWALRALALALALLAWASISLDRERQAERPVVATVQYSIPNQLVLLEPVESVTVRLSGPQSSFANLNPFEVFVVVDLTDRLEGATEVPLTPSDVIRPAGLQVVSIEPNLLTLDLDRLASEMRPVVPRFAGEPSAGAVVGAPSVSPESVLVRGPASTLRQVESVDTRPVDLTGHAISFSEQSLVVSPDPLITVIEPAVVTVRIPLEIPNAPDLDAESEDAASRTPSAN